MNAQHTPAPWEPMTAGGKQYVVGGPYLNNGVAYIYGVTPENITANARLIAAAPDLLEALGFVDRRYGADRRTVWVDLNERGVAALADIRKEAA